MGDDRRAMAVSGRGEPGKRGPRSAEGGRASALRRAHRDSADRGVGWAGGALAQRSGPRAGWKGERIGLDPGGREVGRGVTGPAGKEEKGSWAGLLLGFGLVGVSSSFSFLIQTNLTQMNPNLNLNSLKHSNKLNNQNVHQHEYNNKVLTYDKF